MKTGTAVMNSMRASGVKISEAVGDATTTKTAPCTRANGCTINAGVTECCDCVIHYA